MTKNEYQNKLTQYISEKAAGMVTDLFYNEEGLQLIVNRPRNTKLGDYRAPHPRQPYHKITVNANLESNEFFITLLHEYAHYLIYLTHKNTVSPHGKEWKSTFRMLLRQAIQQGCFSDKIAKAVVKCYFEKESIASGTCKAIKEALGIKPNGIVVSELSINTEFLLQGKAFRKGAKLKTRYECTELSTGKKYRVHPDAVIDRILKN